MAENVQLVPENKTQQAIQESNTSLLDLVGSENEKNAPKVKKIYPANQISPLLESFENDLIKKREEE